MIGYEAATRQAALEQAAKDKIWSAAERKVLQAVADASGDWAIEVCGGVVFRTNDGRYPIWALKTVAGETVGLLVELA